MPIYAYKCASCGHARDVLQKISDAPLTDCPACGAPAFNKQLTAAGFQLKGSGWYATDFRNGSTAAPATSEGAAEKPADKAADKAADKPADTASKPDTAAAPSTKTEGPSASASGGGAACASH